MPVEAVGLAVDPDAMTIEGGVADERLCGGYLSRDGCRHKYWYTP